MNEHEVKTYMLVCVSVYKAGTGKSGKNSEIPKLLWSISVIPVDLSVLLGILLRGTYLFFSTGILLQLARLIMYCSN